VLLDDRQIVGRGGTTRATPVGSPTDDLFVGRFLERSSTRAAESCRGHDEDAADAVEVGGRCVLPVKGTIRATTYGQATRRREGRAGDTPVIAGRGPGGVPSAMAGGRDRVAPPPHLHLVDPELGRRLQLALALERPVVALVSGASAGGPDPGAPELVEGQVGRPHRPGQHRRVWRTRRSRPRSCWPPKEPSGRTGLVLTLGVSRHRTIR